MAQNWSTALRQHANKLIKAGKIRVEMETIVSKMGLHFVVGKHPAHGRVNIRCGLSGHGFNFASVLGEVLAQLALDGASDCRSGSSAPLRFA